MCRYLWAFLSLACICSSARYSGYEAGTLPPLKTIAQTLQVMMAMVMVTVVKTIHDTGRYRPICSKCARNSNLMTSCKLCCQNAQKLCNIQRRYVNSVLTGNHLALQQQQQQQLASKKDSIPEERLAMIPTPRAASKGAEQLPPEQEAREQAARHASDYSDTCMANDHAPIGLVVKQTLAQSNTLDLTKCASQFA